MRKFGNSASQRGAVALAVPLLLLLIIAAVFYILITQGIIKTSIPVPSIPGTKKEPTVTLQNQYQNPFDKSSGYRNPFSEYANPFDALKNK